MNMQSQNFTKLRPVVFVIYPDITLLDLAGSLQVFESCGYRGRADEPYETAIVSIDGGRIKTDTMLSIDSDPFSVWENRAIHTLVVVGGDGVYPALEDSHLIDGLTALIKQSSRVCSVCSGALLLAASGILNGKRAVTHWEDCAQLVERFPEVKVEADPIFVKDGHVWTSAGVTSGIDMTLALVTEDLGQETAMKIARSLVTYMVRPGGQSQFSPALDRQSLDTSGHFKGLHDWIADNLGQDLRVEQLAAHVNMSPRNFARVYTAKTGQTPAKTVEAIRTDRACQLLETTDLPITTVAAQCGFIDDERMRRAFLRILLIAPNDYRRRFQVVGG